MRPPFTAEQFFDVFIAYNTTVYPAQIVLVLVGVAAVAIAFRREPWQGRVVAGLLAVLWLWMGVVYHWAFFSRINPAARFFGALFVAEALLLLWLALRREPLRIEPGADRVGIAGGFLIVYAFVLYPLLGMLAGHAYPAQPTFGLPCPTTILTMGLLLWARNRVPWPALVVPAAWSVLGLSAVRFFGVFEDALLPLAGLAGGALVLWKNHRAAE